jgi:hypothetical protein
MEGGVSGNSVQIKTAYRELAYTAYFVGTVSPDGETMSGTWDTGSFLSAAGSTKTWLAHKTGGGQPSPGGGQPSPGGGQPSLNYSTVTQVHCNYLVLTGVDTCTAQVADARPGATLRPSGTVKFSSANGGSFFAGDSCTLVPTSASPNVSSCSAEFLPLANKFPAVAASYQGSTEHAPSIGRTTFYFLGGPAFGVDWGSSPKLGRKKMSPITMGCPASKAKQPQGKKAEASGDPIDPCIVTLSATLEYLKNKAIDRPCDGPLRDFGDLKNCRPVIRDALAEWEQQKLNDEFLKLSDLMKEQNALFKEMKKIIDENGGPTKGAKNSSRASAQIGPSLVSKRRSRSVELGSGRVLVKAGKQKATQLKITPRGKKVLTFVRRMNKALPTLKLPVSVTFRVSVTTRSSKKAKPKRKTSKRVVPFQVSP